MTDICRTASFSISRIAKIRNYLDRKSTERLIHAFVSSILDYCNLLLCILPKNGIARLHRIQNAAARLVTLSKMTTIY